METSNETCVLVSQEGDRFVVEKKVAMMSELVKIMHEDGDDGEIPLINVKSVILAKVIEFCKYHTENGEMPEIERVM